MKRIVDRLIQAVRDAVQEAAQAQAEQTREQIDREIRQAEETARENQLALERRLDEYMARQEERLAALEAKLGGVTQPSDRQDWDELEPRMEQSVRTVADEYFPKLDKRIEWWTWERYLRIQNKLVPQIDKQIERWTWERYRRTRKDGMAQIWNILYELEQEKMCRAVSQSPTYDVGFYWYNRYGSINSASRVLSVLFTWVSHDSMVDFGCGTGTWLWIAQALGVQDVLGIDGAYVPKTMRMIPEDRFLEADLERQVKLDRRFDLAISMEVAEHLRPEAADTFVESLCAAADIVLFSAAHPGQGGDGHVNEQPAEYWEEKFAARGYRTIEIRSLFQNAANVEKWYRDNMALFVQADQYEGIAANVARTKDG